jgi:drug/metabolite transporter (DMT)-like permease
VIEARSRPDVLTIAAFLGVALFGGLNTISVKVVVADLAPFWSAAVRFLAAGLLLVGVVLATRRAFPRGRSLAGAAVYGAIAFTGSYALLYSALQYANAGTVAVFLALVPLETFALAILQRQERFRARGVVGAVIALVGVAVVMSDQLGAAVPPLAFLLIFGGTLFIAQGGVVLKWIPRADPYATNAVAMVTGGALLLALSVVAGEPWAAPGTIRVWALMGYLVVLGSIGLFGLYLYAVRRWTASGVSYATLLMPLVAVPLAALLVDERVSPIFVAGAAIAVAGTYVGAFSAARPSPSTATAAPECLPIEDCPELPAPVAARQA